MTETFALAGFFCNNKGHSFDGTRRDEYGRCPKCEAELRGKNLNKGESELSDVDLSSGFEETFVITEPPSRAFVDKLRDFDEHATAAVAHLIAWLSRESDVLTAMARGRLAEGHYRYGDKYLFELSPEELDANAAQELADAIVYIARRFTLGTK